jgi:hypothetical protein
MNLQISYKMSHKISAFETGHTSSTRQGGSLLEAPWLLTAWGEVSSELSIVRGFLPAGACILPHFSLFYKLLQCFISRAFYKVTGL